jgi:hypothetical protein
MSTTHTTNRGDGQTPSDAAGLADRARTGAADLASQARDSLGGYAAAQREAGASAIHDVAKAAHSVADQMQGTRPEIARYAREAASVVDDLSDAVRNRSLGDIIRSVDGFARREPIAFFGTALLAGFAISRFLGSSSRAATFQDGMRGSAQDQGYGMHGGSPMQGGSSAQGSSQHRAPMQGSSSQGMGGQASGGSSFGGSAGGSSSGGGMSSGTSAASHGSAGGASSTTGTAKPSAAGSEFARHTDSGSGLAAGASAGTTVPSGTGSHAQPSHAQSAHTPSGGSPAGAGPGTSASGQSGASQVAGSTVPRSTEGPVTTTPPSLATRVSDGGPVAPARSIGDGPAKPGETHPNPAGPKH